jgi:hypothetical protein
VRTLSVPCIAARVGLLAQTPNAASERSPRCGKVGAMTHADIALTWQQIEVWSYDAAATRPIRIERIAELDDFTPAVYQLEFLDSSGALTDGPNTYVGETGGIRSRLETHRYGRGGHGRKQRAAIVRHLQEGGSVRVSVLEVNGLVEIGGERLLRNRCHGSCAGCSNRPRSLRLARRVPCCSISSPAGRRRRTRHWDVVRLRRRTRHRAM